MKIDVTKIPDYETLTAEEKLKALEGYEFDEPKSNNDEVTKLKKYVSDYSSQIADMKKQMREKMTEDERKEAERAEREKARDEELATLKKEKALSGYKAKFLAQGYDEELAEKASVAMTDGNFEGVFDTLGTFIQNKTKQIEAKALNQQPDLSKGNQITQQDIADRENAQLRKAFGLD